MTTCDTRLLNEETYRAIRLFEDKSLLEITRMTPTSQGPPFVSEDESRGWEAALWEFAHQADHLEARGAYRTATVLREAIKLARAGGLLCEHRPAPRH